MPPPTPGVDTDEAESEDLPLDVSVEPDEPVTQQQAALPPRPKQIPAEERPPIDDRDTPTTVTPMAAYASPQSKAPPSLSRSDVPEAEPKKKGAGSIIGLIVVLLLIAGVVAYVMLYAPSDSTTKVSIQVAKSRDVVRWYDGDGKLDKAPPRNLAFGEAGKVTDVVAAGTEVKAGMPLATLDGYTKVEKELVDVKDRMGFYQKQLEAAGAKGDTEAQKSAESKVTEKRKLLGELEARAGKLRLVAPGPGVVEKVRVSAGAEAKPAETAIELTDKRVAAIFQLTPAAASSLKVGDTASLQSSADSKPVDGKIAKLDGGEVTVEVGEDAMLKAGDAVHLVKSRLSNVVVVPASSVSKKGAVDTVFVLAQGELHAKTITVADRSATEVYVSAGLAPGDSVVTSAVAGLTDGQKASAAQ